MTPEQKAAQFDATLALIRRSLAAAGGIPGGPNQYQLGYLNGLRWVLSSIEDQEAPDVARAAGPV